MDETEPLLTLEELHSIGERMLNFFDEFCSENDLKYWLAYGSLLGAVRHQGPIPWDEDVDVFMPLDDFYKLANSWEKLQKGPIVLQCYQSDSRYQLEPMRLRMRGTFYPTRPSVNCGWKEQGAWLDIYPLYPQKHRGFFGKARYKISAAANTMTYHRIYSDAACFGQAGKIMLLAHKVVMAIAHVAPLETWMNLRRTVREFGLSNRGDCSYLVHFGSGYGYEKCTFEASWFKDTIRLKYGQHFFSAPGDWDALLTYIYGDYMTPVVRKSALFSDENSQI